MNNLQRKNDVLKKELESLKEVSKKIKNNREVANKYSLMAIDPSGHMCRTPAFGVPRGATRHFTRTFTMNSAGAGSEFGIKLSPDVSDFLTMQGGINVIPVTGLRFAKNAFSPNSSFFDISSGSLVLTSQRSDDDNYVYWTTTLGTGAVVRPTGFDITNASGQVQIYTISYVYAGGVEAGARVIGLYPGESSAGLAPSFSAATERVYGIKVHPGKAHVYYFSFTDSEATAVTASSLSRPIIQDSWLELGQVTKYRVSAMSILATYRGNLLANAGVIAAARAPSALAYDGSTTMYTGITKLPEDKYKGPLVEGAYAWWLPADETELDFRARGNLPYDSTSLYIGGEFGDAEGALEITVDVVVDFYSPLQIFERKHYPPMSEDFFESLKYLSELPAATCNPKHLDLLKQGMSKVAKGVLSGVDLARKNPELVNAFLKALAGVAAFV